MNRHRAFNPDGLAPAVGFSYGVMPAEGRTLYLAGMTGHRPDLSIDEGIVDQFRAACSSLARVIEDAGGAPEDLVSLTIYTSQIDSYRDNLEPLGEAWRSVFGRWYPAMALIGVDELFDPEAVVELVGIAVVA